MADGANAEFGRSHGGFVNVITKSGTNEMHGTAHFVFKNDALCSNAAEARRQPRRRSSTPISTRPASPSAARSSGTSCSTSPPSTSRRRDRPSRPTRPHRASASSTAFAALGVAERERPDRAHQRRPRVPGQGRLARPPPRNLVTLRYNYTWSEQKNGTFDVDSWGAAPTPSEKDYSHAVSGSLISTRAQQPAQRVPLPVRAGGPPARRTTGPIITGRTEPAAARHRLRLRQHATASAMPFFIPVEYYDTRIQLNDNVSFLRGAHSFKAGVEYNRRELGADLRRLRQRPLHLRLHGRLPQLRQTRTTSSARTAALADRHCPAGPHHRPGAPLPAAGRRRRTSPSRRRARRASRRREPAVFLQDTWQAAPNLNVQYGLRWEAQIEPDPITPADEVFYAPFIGKTVGRDRSSRRTARSRPTTSMWQPRLGISWNPSGDGKQGRCAPTPASSTAASPAWPWPRRARPTAAAARRSSAAAPSTSTAPVPAYPNKLIPPSQSARPIIPTSSSSTRTSRTRARRRLALSWEQELIPEYAFLVKYNYAKGEHITRFVNRNDPLLIGVARELHVRLRSLEQRPGAAANGIGTLTVVESTARSLYQGVTLGLTKRPSHNCSSRPTTPIRRTSRTTTTSAIRSPSAMPRSRTSTPSTATPTATSAIASMAGCCGMRRMAST